MKTETYHLKGDGFGLAVLGGGSAGFAAAIQAAAEGVRVALAALTLDKDVAELSCCAA